MVCFEGELRGTVAKDSALRGWLFFTTGKIFKSYNIAGFYVVYYIFARQTLSDKSKSFITQSLR